MSEKLKKLDWPIVVILVVFMVVSTLVIRSAILSRPDWAGMDVKNMIFYAIGFVALMVVALTDYRIWFRGTLLIYVLGVLLLVSVLLWGREINGAKSWFVLADGLSFQPAELFKIVLIMTAAYLISKREGEPLEFFRDLIPIFICVAIPFVLVMAQPDLGNAVIYLVILTGMLWIGNLKYSHVLAGILIVAVFVAAFLFMYDKYHDPLYEYLLAQGKSHWMDRIDTFLDPENVSEDARYQLNKSLIAIGSAGMFGEGYMQGTSVHNSFVPYTYSDSVFVVIGEEFGFMGASVLLMIYFFLMYRLILIAIQCTHFGGALMIIGIVTMFVFQIFENIGMLIGIMPLTGITLPFISYGGTSLLINMLSIGIVMSIKIHHAAPSPLFTD